MNEFLQFIDNQRPSTKLFKA